MKRKLLIMLMVILSGCNNISTNEKLHNYFEEKTFTACYFEGYTKNIVDKDRIFMSIQKKQL
ncbi:uncharacterized protein YceK [Breznakia sp. PF5-3]|uniref:hypothetical protein n=1 Tax=unclassified Breznakia TaxID=2623764 RepID=UPI00240698F0|nr:MULTISPECIES: hypothetical protein [unclassified Breznakia]MDF9825356.1 uncharacterized protein YceK [Breznakia sp. PM6-1]MDF9836234.1 uncharacterized protein YceK [Breznakia sp. PF5-3]MDF9838526.1 uncharacterized protein YceK [Breznakia sp. PFB2-8]MDF9860479.1 uncharacterized protein YceK [Breznakia sp. PH5-24]